jgi:CRP-like cAMP-binding protein
MLHLSQVPVAAMVPPTVLRAIAAFLEPRTFAPGEVVVRQGEPVDAMYLLTDGALALTKDGEAFGEIKAPQTIGFLGILARQESPYEAVAKDEARAFELETDTLLELFEDHFSLFTATLKYLAERLYLDFQELPQEALGLPAIDLGKVGPSPLDLFDRVLRLRKMSAFTTANVNAIATMARGMEELRAPAFTKLWDVGERPDRACFLVQGTVVNRTADGRVFRYGPGTAVGGIETLAGRPRWYEAMTETDVVGLWGSSDEMLDLFEQQFRMAMDFVSSLANAQLALVARRAKLGQNPLAAVRSVRKLGTIRYGA